jgi:hypothetical protein
MGFVRSAVLSVGGLSLGLAFAFSAPASLRADDDDDRRERQQEAAERFRERQEELRERREERNEEARERWEDWLEDRDDDDRRSWRFRGHHGSRFGQNNWRFVVPHTKNNAGAYFSIGKGHFYTPSPVAPLFRSGLVANAPPPAAVQIQQPVELRFGGFQRHNDLGGRLEFAANLICLEMNYNYRGNLGFDLAYRRAYGLLQVARDIHSDQHQGDRRAIQARADDVDRLFHYLRGQVRYWTPTGNARVGDGGLTSKLANLEAIIHHLCWEVGVEPHGRYSGEGPMIDVNQGAPPPPPMPNR